MGLPGTVGLCLLFTLQTLCLVFPGLAVKQCFGLHIQQSTLGMQS